MIARKVGPDLRMAVVATPAYLAQAGPIDEPADLTRHRCINYRMTGSGTLYAWEFERDGRAFAVRVSGPLALNEPELMLAAALDNLGVAYLLDHEIASYVEKGTLVRLLVDWTPSFPGFHLYYSSKRQMRPILAAFVDAVGRSMR
jgi:DNA-binding transcriptional LysR family regulator